MSEELPPSPNPAPPDPPPEQPEAPGALPPSVAPPLLVTQAASPPPLPPPLPEAGGTIPSTPPGPRRPGWFELVIGVAIIWGADMGMGLLLAAGALIQGKRSPAAIEGFIQTPVFLIITALFSGAVCLVVSWYMICRRFERPVREGLALQWIGLSKAGMGILLGIVGAVFAGVLMSLFSTGESFISKLVEEPGGKIVLSVIALLLPFTEEVYYRGFIYPILARYIKGWAVPAVALWFASAHAFQLAGDWMGIPVIFCMGLLWTWLRHRTGSLLPGLIAHWIYNFILVLAMWVFPEV